MTAQTRLKKLVAASALMLVPVLASAQPSEDRLTIAIVGIAVGFGVLLTVAIVGMSLLGPYLSQRRQAELIEKFLEQGREIPPELLAKPTAPSLPLETAAQYRARSMRRGIVLLALAAGVALVFYVGFDSPQAAAWGLLFLCLSIASFINARYFSGAESSD